MLHFCRNPALPSPCCSATSLKRCRCAGAGMMWAWDLSATLGWSSGGGPGGSWLASSTTSPWEVHMSS